MTIRLALACLLLAAPVHAEALKTIADGTIAVAASTSLFEIVLTEAAVQRGTGSEVNPWMPKGTRPIDTVGRATIKSASATGITMLLLHLRDEHPKWAIAGASLYLMANGYLAVRGWHALR